ncbi:MAG: heptosyltransferase-1 [Planctomycetota bacterium]
MRFNRPVGSPYSPEQPPKRILVIRLGAVGDLVRTLPAVLSLRETWPDAEIAWAVEQHVAPLIEGHPCIDKLIIINRDNLLAEARRFRPKALSRIIRFGREVREFAPDLSIDFQGCFKSGLASALSRAPVRIGFDREHVREWSHLFANVRLPLAKADQHRVRRALALARGAGAREVNISADLALTQEERQTARDFLKEIAHGRAVVAVAPFSSDRQAWKRYPRDSWCEVVRGLALQGYVVLLLAGPGEEEESREIAKQVGPGVVPTQGVGLRNLAALLEECELLVGGDTGPMHLAWGVGTPVVALYGPTDPALNAPVGDGHILLHPERRTCRDDADRFPGITPQRVLSEALGLLSARVSCASVK